MSEKTGNSFCNGCGAALREGVSFCATCGHTVARQMAPALVPAGPMYFPTPAGSPTAKKGWGAVRILVMVFVIVPLFIVAAVTVGLVVWSSQNPPCVRVHTAPRPGSRGSRVHQRLQRPWS